MDTHSDKVLKRTHSCGKLRIEDVGHDVRLCGWVRSYRDHGGLVFIDLRDRDGVTQCVFDPDEAQSEEIHTLARSLRNEWVISIAGKVRPRGEGKENPKLPTGQVEIVCSDLTLLSRSEPVPFEPDAWSDTSEELRLRYRYIDFRRPALTAALRTRHSICKSMRDTLDAEDFIEVETPFLTKSTPEGARDFLVPSRQLTGGFYALPQSPQLFKQILMVGGLDKYYQIVRCFRDEDLRADRQPEFTQLDLEMSFCTEADIMGATNDILRNVCHVCEKPFPERVPVMEYDEAMRRFGSDRPDLRFGMELIDISELASKTDFRVFSGAVEAGGCVQCICIPGAAEMPRRETDALAEWVKQFGAGGMPIVKVGADRTLETGIAKFLTPIAEELVNKVEAEPGDLICFAADTVKTVRRVLGELRCKLAKDRNMIDANAFEWVWVVDFPLVDWNEDEQRYDALHHPFTAPNLDDWDTRIDKPETIRSRAYDIVCNGTEMGGGSIRIHRPAMQSKVFEMLGIGAEEAEEKFGFLLDALKFGAPPHGGLALGLDRVVMLMIGAQSLREVIAFPKTKQGSCLMTNAPSAVDEGQLAELDLRVITPAPTPEK